MKRSHQRPAVHPWHALPFVAHRPLPATGVDFWAPRPTGDYARDCDLGTEWAKQALPHLRGEDGGRLLAWIALGMAERGGGEAEKGLIVGFMGTVGEALAPSAQRRDFAPSLDELARRFARARGMAAA